MSNSQLDQEMTEELKRESMAARTCCSKKWGAKWTGVKTRRFLETELSSPLTLYMDVISEGVCHLVSFDVQY